MSNVKCGFICDNMCNIRAIVSVSLRKNGSKYMHGVIYLHFIALSEALVRVQLCHQNYLLHASLKGDICQNIYRNHYDNERTKNIASCLYDLFVKAQGSKLTGAQGPLAP